jgi:transcriptional regulator with XRE-family HTH domain
MSTDNKLTKQFTRALNYYIAISGKTKKDIADSIGVPPTTFSSWSNGKHLPDMDRLQVLATYLEAPVSQFFEFTSLSAPTPPDPFEEELVEAYRLLSASDKLLLRSMAIRMAQKEE